MTQCWCDDDCAPVSRAAMGLGPAVRRLKNRYRIIASIRCFCWITMCSSEVPWDCAFAPRGETDKVLQPCGFFRRVHVRNVCNCAFAPASNHLTVFKSKAAVAAGAKLLPRTSRTTPFLQGVSRQGPEGRGPCTEGSPTRTPLAVYVANLVRRVKRGTLYYSASPLQRLCGRRHRAAQPALEPAEAMRTGRVCLVRVGALQPPRQRCAL